ncbi:MAG: hypothetical protein JW900_08190 [Anaerolineae bacterium]|nr:hypothetical protein [Anaerolineae bacterium]
MYPDSEILFPPRCISQLRDERGKEWVQLIDHLTSLPNEHEDVLGFSLLMIKLSSCLTCDLDSYRASLGCCTCASRTVGGFKGSDADMVRLFEDAREEVREYLAQDGLPMGVVALIHSEG